MSVLCVKSQKKHWKSFKLFALCDSFTASGIPSPQRPHTVHTSGSISMKYREHCEPLRSGSLVNEHSLKSLSLLLINQLLLARPVLASKSMTALLRLGNLCMRDSKKNNKKKLFWRLLILLLHNFGCFHWTVDGALLHIREMKWKHVQTIKSLQIIRRQTDLFSMFIWISNIYKF